MAGFHKERKEAMATKTKKEAESAKGTRAGKPLKGVGKPKSFKSAKGKKAATEKSRLEKIKRLTSVSALNRTGDHFAAMAKVVSELARSANGSERTTTDAEIAELVNELMDSFTDAVVALAVAAMLSMPGHWKREWLNDVCELKGEEG